LGDRTSETLGDRTSENVGDRTRYFPLPLRPYIIKIKISQSLITEHLIPANRISGETCFAIAHSVARASCLYNRECDHATDTLRDRLN
ncbi:hypothetical protein, partial [Limnospira platensis]|uniref:hypothetical protein n=1 Tax=Limnospira platensis TaxID=118562 RepID=UPI00396C4E26